MLPDDADIRDGLSPDGLEGRLAAWRPSAGGLDRDALLFEAGRASARAEASAPLRLASGSAAALAALAVGLGGLLAAERGRRHDLEVALARSAPAPPGAAARPEAGPSPSGEPRPAEAPAPTSYLALTHRALGPGGLGPPEWPGAGEPRDGPREPRPPAPTLRVRGAEGRIGL
jgi:hypothetical protein